MLSHISSCSVSSEVRKTLKGTHLANGFNVSRIKYSKYGVSRSCPGPGTNEEIYVLMFFWKKGIKVNFP